MEQKNCDAEALKPDNASAATAAVCLP